MRVILFLLTAVMIAGAILLGSQAFNLASNQVGDWGSSSVAASAGQTFEVGPNWVEKAVPKDMAWNTQTDAPVWIHTGKVVYVLEPDGSIMKGDHRGNMVPAPPCWPSGIPCLDLGGADKISFKAVHARAKVTMGPSRPGNV